jgi:hypothetical protein
MMIRKLTEKQQKELLAKKEKAFKEVIGGSPWGPDLPGELHDLLCSKWCEEYCGEKSGSDGIMWVGNRDIR